jgi:hypothetical protein
MGEQLRRGDRIRVRDANRPHGCRVGDTGRIVWVTPAAGPDAGVLFVHCEMDRAGPGRLASFYPDEVERVP